jgi:uncharacterized membrane protein
MNNKNSIAVCVTCALLSLGLAAATRATEFPAEIAVLTIHFRASGYEPTWLFESDRPGGIRFSAEGRAHVHLPAADFSVSDRHRGLIYGSRSDERDFVAEIVEITCTDAFSGELLSHTVTIHVDAREYHGCGGRVNDPGTLEHAAASDALRRLIKE